MKAYPIHWTTYWRLERWFGKEKEGAVSFWMAMGKNWKSRGRNGCLKSHYTLGWCWTSTKRGLWKKFTV